MPLNALMILGTKWNASPPHNVRVKLPYSIRGSKENIYFVLKPKDNKFRLPSLTNRFYLR